MNVKEIREKLRLSQQELADKTGIPKDRIAKWEQGKGSPKVEDSAILKKFFEEDVPRELNEKSESYGLSEGTELIESLHDAKDYLSKRRALKTNDEVLMVPLVPVKAQAGYAKGYGNTDFVQKLKTYPILPGIDPHGADWRYFEVEGDSMEETFKQGQYILASQVIKEDWRDISNFYVYVIITDDKVMIKRLAKVKGKDYWAAISDNEDKHRQFRLPVADVKELWKYRRHIDWSASTPKKFEVKV